MMIHSAPQEYAPGVIGAAGVGASVVGDGVVGAVAFKVPPPPRVMSKCPETAMTVIKQQEKKRNKIFIKIN